LCFAVLAAMLDVSRETVARTFGRLEKENIISKKPGGVVILDAQRLVDQ